MPPHKDSGTPKRKTTRCYFPGCTSRPRSGAKRMAHHFATVHGIDNHTEWFRVQFERYTMGLPSCYDRYDIAEMG